jgi:hypothetical protein
MFCSSIIACLFGCGGLYALSNAAQAAVVCAKILKNSGKVFTKKCRPQILRTAADVV